MSFRFSSGTLDSLAGVYAPAKKHKAGSGGGHAHGPHSGGEFLAKLFHSAPKQSQNGRLSPQAKRAFGGGTSAAATGRAIHAMERTARRSPEVVVRITGRQNGGGHVLANFAYISRLGHGDDVQVPLYTSDEDVLRDGKNMQVLAQDWQEWEVGGEDRRKGATSISMVLSMPAKTDPEALKASALDFAREEFSNRAWVAALHLDRDHPHVHLTIARRDQDGRRFHPNRDDLFRYRQRFAQKLRNRGIEANATPARARGIDPKHEPIAAKKMREKGVVPRIDKSRAERAQKFRDRGLADPVKRVLADRHAVVLQTYSASILELSSSPSLADQVTAQMLSKFIEAMPEPESNSERTARLAHSSREVLDAGKPLDPVEAALAKAASVRSRIEAEMKERGAREAAQTSLSPGTHTVPETDMSERLRALREATNDLASEGLSKQLNDRVQQARNLHREPLERDRTKDRGGPGR